MAGADFALVKQQWDEQERHSAQQREAERHLLGKCHASMIQQQAAQAAELPPPAPRVVEPPVALMKQVADLEKALKQANSLNGALAKAAEERDARTDTIELLSAVIRHLIGRD